MGIPSLTSFINNFFTGWKEEKLGEYLVIDGCSLCYYLYTFDWINGGQYTDYYRNMVDFFGALRSSEVESIVVIDGYAYPKEKSDTVNKRNAAKAQEVCDQFIESRSSTSPKRASSSVHSASKTDVLPLLAPAVFQEVLCELNITCIMVDGEADKEIAQLANFYSCPVLSNDSDFYMFPLKGGFIHLTMFDWRTCPLTAKVYHMDAFVEQFNLAHNSLRFIVPAICGNDFLPSVAGQCRRYVQHIKQVTLYIKGKHHPIKSVIDYASHYDNIEDFITRIKSGTTNYLNEGGKDHLIDNCMKATLQYNIQDVVSLENIHSKTQLSLVSEHPLPRWLLQQIRACKYTAGLLMLICEGGLESPVPIGNPNRGNPLFTSLPLRQAIYSLLHLHPFVSEGIFDRLKMVDVQVCTRIIVCEREVITLDMLPDLGLRKRKKIMYYFLHSNADLMELLEPKWRLVISSVIYWSRAEVIPIIMMKILILTFILCSRSTTAPNDPLRLYHSVKIRRSFLRTPTWWEGLHCFAQWQCVYGVACDLNMILQLPLQILSAAHIFNGEMAMHILYTGDVSVVVSKLESSDRELYDQLLSAVLSHKSKLYEPYASITVCDRRSEMVPPRRPEAPTCATSLFSHHVIE